MKYKIKLDELSEYFKQELSLLNESYKKSSNDQQFIYTSSILIFSALMVLIASLIQIFFSPQLLALAIATKIITLIEILITIVMIGMVYSIIHNIYYSRKAYNEFFSKKYSLEYIIKFLLHLKFIDIKQEDLNELSERIKFDFRDNRKHLVKNLKEYKTLEKVRFTEYENIICKINKNIIDREK